MLNEKTPALTISIRQSDMMCHALGMQRRFGKLPRWSHRNRYCIGPYDLAFREWIDLIDKGYACILCTINEGNDALFSVTTKGINAISGEIAKRVRKEDIVQSVCCIDTRGIV